MEDALILNFTGFNASEHYQVASEFDYASALQYVNGLPKVLFWIVLASFCLFVVRLWLAKANWHGHESDLKHLSYLAVDFTSFILLGIGCLLLFLFCFKPTPEILKIIMKFGWVVAVVLFGIFGYMLWKNNKREE